ncbi:MAG TPA: preprotein translocase subunit YajC [Pirellulaceae bacterium]|nr:preprotein translocase subunit YajC [Planctomycetales bacterium]MCB9937698.1 preprotein translocase subunit YajC [Planctomycetaceae bacterium]HRX79640.1 preprotein translocase subunit YajC [Pirellulaceae bacterium]
MWSTSESYLSILLLAQDDTATSPFGPIGSLLPFVMIAVLFYFMLIRPERKKRAETTSMLENMKKNDRVVTIGGIHGVVVNVQKDSEDVTLRIDDSTNTKMRVLRSAISRIVKDDGEGSQD